MHQNDQKHTIKQGNARFVNFIDTSGKETLHVSFAPCLDKISFYSKYPVEFFIDDIKFSAVQGKWYNLRLEKEIVFPTQSVETPRITVRITKLETAQWPSPEPEEKTRAPTLDYEAAPSKVCSPFPECEPVRNTPAPPMKQPKQAPKKRKRHDKHFFMC